jgi:phage-related protein
MQQTDTDRGFRIRYGKNARGITWRRSSANLVTRVVPVAKGEDGSDLYLPEMWIDSPLISAYPVILMERLSVKGQVGKAKGDDQAGTWTESDLLDEMRAKAEERFTVDHADEIVQEVTVQFEQLGDTAEYAGLKELETVLLYDTVTAEDPRIGLQRQLYVSELEFDIIRKKVVGVKLSNVAEIMRSVTGYNVQNNSISSVKLTDEAKQEIITEAQDGVEEIAKGAEIVVIDSLTSTSGTSALSANQGKVLKGLIDKLLDTKDATNLNDITETCITYATSTTQNAPTSSCFVLTMVRSTGATVQFALRAASNAAYYRRKSSGTWDGWQKFTISAV